MAEAYRGFLSAWDDVRTHIEEVLDVDCERVRLLTHSSGRGKTSGLELGPISASTAVLFHFGGGKVTRLVLYWERDQLRHLRHFLLTGVARSLIEPGQPWPQTVKP